MIEINLLPKNYQKRSLSFSFGKSGIYVMVGTVGIILMLIGITFYQIHQLDNLDRNIERARQRSAMLLKDIKVVDALIDVKEKINERMTAVEKLDRHRSAYVRVLEDLARNVPEFIWLARFVEEIPKEPAVSKNDKNKPEITAPVPTKAVPEIRKVSLEGYSFTLNALAKFMINMMRSDYFDEVELVSTEEKILDEQKAYNFVLSCNLHFLSDDALRQLIAQSKESSGSQKTSHKVLN